MTFFSAAEYIVHKYVFITAKPYLEIVKQGALSSFIVFVVFFFYKIK